MNDPKRIIIVVSAFALLSLGCFGIKNHMDSAGYKQQVNYTTAIQAKNKEQFNYAIDSQQGRILASGEFSTAKNKQAKFPEMNKGYSYVSRDKEHYTMHTRTVCNSNGKTTTCHTEVYYTWDVVEREEVYADKISFMGRDYPPTLFNYSKFTGSTDCLEFAKAGTSGWFRSSKGCVDGDIYLTDDDRYVYRTVPSTFTASFLASSEGGGLKGFSEPRISLQNKSIDQILKDVGKYQLIGFWVLTVLLVILFIAAAVGAYYWVMQDGEWSTER